MLHNICYMTYEDVLYDNHVNLWKHNWAFLTSIFSDIHILFSLGEYLMLYTIFISVVFHVILYYQSAV